MYKFIESIQTTADDWFEKGYHWYIIIAVGILFVYIIFNILK